MDVGGFRSSMFGGFNRSDVAAYITAMSKELNEYKAECERLKAEKKELLSKIDFLSDQVSGLMRENDEISRQSENVEALKARIEALKAKVDEDAKTIETFNKLKGRLSSLEVEACKRAQEIEAAATEKYERIMSKLMNTIAALKIEYEDIRCGTEITAAHLRGEISNIDKRIGLVSSVLDKTANDFNELEKFVKDSEQGQTD